LHACTVRQIELVSGIITTVMGIPYECGYNHDTGVGTEIKLNKPYSVINQYGNLFVADSRNHMIRQYEKSSGNIISCLKSTTAGPLNFPMIVYSTIRGGTYLYFSEKLSSDIHGVMIAPDPNSNSGVPVLQPTSAVIYATLSLETKITYQEPVDGGITSLTEESFPSHFNHIKGITSTDTGLFIVADSGHHRILELSAHGIRRKLTGFSSSLSSSLASFASMFSFTALTSSSTSTATSSSVIPPAVLTSFLLVSFFLVFMFLRQKMKKKVDNKKINNVINEDKEEEQLSEMVV
jgi:hypothetical protein